MEPPEEKQQYFPEYTEKLANFVNILRNGIFCNACNNIREIKIEEKLNK